jgi:hypothetical protein
MNDDDLHLLLARRSGAPVLQDPLRADALASDGPIDDNPDFLWEEGDDPNALPEQRWGVIAPQGADGDRLLALIQPLIDLREQQQGAKPKIYRAPPRLSPAEAMRWRKRVFEADGGLRSDLPRFLLLLGDLDVLPLSLQQTFAGDAFPGRLCFPSDDGYAAYVAKLLRWERAREAARGAALLCGVHDGSLATQLGERALLGPGGDLLEESCRNGKLDAAIARLDLGADPSPDPLFAGVAAPAQPTVLFSVSHGEGAPKGGWTVDADARARQGAMCFGKRGSLTAADLPSRPFLPGGVWCMLACYGAGTPDASAYHRWLADLAQSGRYMGRPDAVLEALPKDGARPFIAALPQAVLANPDGPLGFIGHIDLAWTYGFQDLDDRVVSRPGRLMATVRGLLRGDRAGVSLRELARGVGMANTEITCLQDQDLAPTGALPPAEQARRAHLWMLRQDLSAYVLLGDPAARLALAPRARPSWSLADAAPDPTLHVAMTSAPEVDADALARLESQIVRHLAGEPLADLAADAGMSRDALQAAVDAYRTAARAALARHLAGR